MATGCHQDLHAGSFCLTEQDPWGGENKTKLYFSCFPPAPFWGVTQSLDILGNCTIIFLSLTSLSRHTGSSVLCWFVCGKSRQVFGVCCFQFPTPGRGFGLLGSQLGILQALPPLGKSSPQNQRKGRIQSGSWTYQFKTPAGAEKQPNSKHKRLEQGAEIRDSQLHRNLHPKLCAKTRWKKMCLQNTLEAQQGLNES